MDRLSLTLSALAHPTRRAMLARLAQGEMTVNELAKPFDLRLPTVSRHLKVLHRAGLVAQSRQAQWRPCRLEAGPIREVAVWAESYRQFWERSFASLDAVLDDLKREKKKRRRK